MTWCWVNPVVADPPSTTPISPRLPPHATCRVPCTHLWLPVSFTQSGCPTKWVNIPRSPLSIKDRQELVDWLFPLSHPSVENYEVYYEGCPQWVGLQLPMAVTCWQHTLYWLSSFSCLTSPLLTVLPGDQHPCKQLIPKSLPQDLLWAEPKLRQLVSTWGLIITFTNSC